jgi:hypothetical protein
LERGRNRDQRATLDGVTAGLPGVEDLMLPHPIIAVAIFLLICSVAAGTIGQLK